VFRAQLDDLPGVSECTFFSELTDHDTVAVIVGVELVRGGCVAQAMSLAQPCVDGEAHSSAHPEQRGRTSRHIRVTFGSRR
jgi:hypothetical protein